MVACVADTTHQVVDRFIVKDGIDIYKCPSCGCLMADMDFVHDQYENDTYYTMIHKSKVDIDVEWGFRWRYVLSRLLQYSKIETLLDVGAGNGYFVDLAINEFSLKAKGLEISKAEIKYAKEIIGVELLEEDVSLHNDSYDAVTIFNVLEHVTDPNGFLEEVVKRVNPRGILVVTTPNPSCIHVRVKGLENWNMIAPPHHINLFTRAGLRKLLEKHNLEEINYETLSTYINFVRKIDTNNLFLRRIFFHTLRMFNLGADHFFITRKIS